MADVLTRFNSLPSGPLGIISMKGCKDIVEKIDKYLVKWRSESKSELKNFIDTDEYIKDSYQIPIDLPRFGSGEGKGVILSSVRGMDLYIVCDCFNYGVTYKMYGQTVPMSPDEHFADLKRIIAAASGHAKRITVVMPMLYEGRQHKRAGRESLDSPIALQELASMGVDRIITFDAHDPRVSNAIPLKSFENVHTNYQMIKALIREVPDIKIDKDHLTVISPDEGGMGRCIYYASVLGLELGMFYKTRDYSKIIDGRHPILSHEYLGSSIEGKDVIIIDDMISSGDSILDVAKQLKALKANRVFICCAFGLFCNGLDAFDEAFKAGYIDRIFTTNTIYRTEELLTKEWYVEVDMSKYISYIVEILNHDASIESIIDTKDRIENLLIRKGYKTVE